MIIRIGKQHRMFRAIEPAEELTDDDMEMFNFDLGGALGGNDPDPDPQVPAVTDPAPAAPAQADPGSTEPAVPGNDNSEPAAVVVPPAADPTVIPPVDPAVHADPAPATPAMTDVEALQAKINELSAQLLEKSAAQPVKPTETPTPPAGATATTEVDDFLGDLDIDEVVAKPELFNKVLSQAVRQAQQQTIEMMLNSLPSLVQPVIRQTIAMEDSIKSFYSEHPLLGNFKQVVGTVANQLQAAEPQASFAELLPKVAQKAYEYLRIDPAGLPKTPATPTPQTQNPKNAGLPSGGGSRQNNNTPAIPALEQEILDLM